MNEVKILRYAQLTFKKEGLDREHIPLSPEETVEMETIKKELCMTHFEIIDRALKNLIDEIEC